MEIGGMYKKMHTDILDVCKQNDIKVMPGEVIIYEMINDLQVNAPKEMLLSPEDMAVFTEKCIDKLKEMGYRVEWEKEKDAGICKIYNTDILATTIHRIMTNSSIPHCPLITIKELGQDVLISEELSAQRYNDSVVYACSDLSQHIKMLYGEEHELNSKFTKYTIFSENCSYEKYLSEVTKRNLTSKKSVKRYKEHRKWRREKRDLIEKKYEEYTDVLLNIEANNKRV